MLTVVLILFASNGIISTEAVSCCPDGWISFNTSCYLFPETAPVHFTEAEHYCKQHGGHVVTIDNGLENGFLKTFLNHIKADETAEPHPDMNIKVATFTVSEKSSNTNRPVDKYGSRAPDTWIGLTDELIEGSWRWTLTKSQPSFTDWIPNEPNDHNGVEDCVVFASIHAYRWDDRPCYYNYTPLCEQRKIETEAEFIG